MKKTTLLIICLLVFFISYKPIQIAFANDEEYEKVDIENNGFETVNQDGTIPGWHSIITGEDDGLLTESTIENDPKYIYSGNQSLKLIDESPQKGIEFKSDKIAIDGDHYYKLTSQVYAEEKSVRIYLKYFDENKIAIPGAEGNILANTPKTWQEEVLEVYAPANAAYAEIWFYKSPAGAGTLVYIDDVVLEKQLPTNEEVLDLPYSVDVEDLGEMVKIGLSQAAIFAEDESGKLFHYITTTGTPSSFTVVDPLTGQQIYTERIEGANDPVWGIDQGSDGNIYFASSGKLYRFNTVLQKIENLGVNPTGNTTMYDIKASSDGKIYGSTFHSSNGGKFFEYDIERAQFKDLGVAKEGQAYARGLGVSDEYVYIGLGEYSHLMRYDRKSGEITEVDIPGISGEKRMLSQIEIVGETLFVYAGDRVHVINETTGKYIRTFDFQNRISPTSTIDPNVVYFKKGDTFYSYDIDEDLVTQVQSIDQPLPDTEFKAHQWLVPETGDFAGKEVLFSMAAYGETMLFEPISGEFRTHIAELATIGTPINTLEHKDGLLFMGGFQRGMSIYDTNKETLVADFPSFHQSESIHFLNNAAYFGTYTGAKIYRFLLDEPVDYNEFGWGNPGLAATIENQNRPYVMQEGDGKLFIGTFPSGSNYAGALSILEEVVDETTGNVTSVNERTFQDIADNRSIIGLAYKDGHVFASTTVYSGSGSVNPPPIQDNATIIKFNPETETVVETITPKIEGIDGDIQIIGDLTVGPDGLIWGILDSFIDSANGYHAAIFALDPETMAVEKSKVITKSPYSTSKYRPYHIRFGDDGVMYTTIGRKLIAIDSNTLQSEDMLPGTTINLMTLSDNGDIYYVSGNKLFRMKKKVTENEFIQIAEIEAPETIVVKFGTKINDLPLPDTISATLSDETTVTLPVNWDTIDSNYDGNTAQSYEFIGILDTTNIDNFNHDEEHTVKIMVEVQAEDEVVDPNEPGDPNEDDNDENDDADDDKENEEEDNSSDGDDSNDGNNENDDADDDKENGNEDNSSDGDDSNDGNNENDDADDDKENGDEDNSSDGDDSNDGNKLPQTNTALYNYLIYGLFIFTAGLVIFILRKYYSTRSH